MGVSEKRALTVYGEMYRYVYRIYGAEVACFCVLSSGLIDGWLREYSISHMNVQKTCSASGREIFGGDLKSPQQTVHRP